MRKNKSLGVTLFMEKSSDTIGKKEFEDVWTRVSGGASASDSSLMPIGAESGERVRALDGLAKTGSALSGIVSNVLTKKDNKENTNKEGNEAVPPNNTEKPSKEPDTGSKSSVAASRASASRAVTQSEASKLLAIMDATAQTAREYSTLAAQSGGELRSASRTMEQLCRSTINDLNAQYYMLTGMKSCPGSVIMQSATVNERLNSIIGTESAVCSACNEAAEETAIVSLQNAYTRAASAAERLERTAEQLLYNLSKT